MIIFSFSDKKSLSHSVNLSPSSSSASSSSRASSLYSKQPLPTSSRSNSLGKDSQNSSIAHLPANGVRDEKRPTPPPPPPRKPTSLDMKLAKLRKEMVSLKLIPRHKYILFINHVYYFTTLIYTVRVIGTARGDWGLSLLLETLHLIKESSFPPLGNTLISQQRS